MHGYVRVSSTAMICIFDAGVSIETVINSLKTERSNGVCSIPRTSKAAKAFGLFRFVLSSSCTVIPVVDAW